MIQQRLRGCRALAAAAVLVVVLAGAAGQAQAAGTPVSTILVKFQGDDPSAQALPPATEMRVRSALGTGVLAAGRTADGAHRLTIVPPLALPDAESALDRLRRDDAVLYATLAEARARGPRRRAALPAGVPDLPLHRLVVKYRGVARVPGAHDAAPGASRLDRVAAVAGMAVSAERQMFNGAHVLRLMSRVPRARLEQIADALELDADVEWAQPDYRDRLLLVPNDPLYATTQWHYSDPVGGINLPNAWNRTTGSPDVAIAVIDSGSLPGHPDLAGRYVGGFDFIEDYIGANDGDPPQPPGCGYPFDPPCISSRDADASDPGDWITATEDNGSDWGGWLLGCADPAPGGQTLDSSWHGTHVAGTLGAATNNGAGGAGVNWMSPIVPVRVLGKCGGWSTDIADGIEWASGGTVPGAPANAHPARVLNLSLGGFRSDQQCDALYQSAIDNALSRNAVIVVAAGNSTEPTVFHSPANCNGVVTVAAIGQAGQRATYSNFDGPDPAGLRIAIAAPGGSDGFFVHSTLNSSATSPNLGAYIYGGYSGTSMATPHVAGVVSLMLSASPSKSASQIVAALRSTARPFPANTGRDCTSNPLLVDAPPFFAKYCGAGIVDADAAIAAMTAPAGTSLALASSSPSTTAGQAVTFTATVTGVAPTGVVRFNANGVAIGRCNEVPLSGAGNARTAQCTTASLAAGTHSIGASYAGDAGNAAATATPVTHTVLIAVLAGTASKQRDFDGETRADLLWRSSTTGRYGIWLMNGTTALFAGAVADVAGSRVTHTADFDGDGRSDLLLHDAATGTTSMALMHGTTVARKGALFSSASWHVEHVADFDGDARTDLLWRDRATGDMSIWLMNGLVAQATSLVPAGPSLRATHVADFDGDGKADVLLRDTATGETSLWFVDGTRISARRPVFTSLDWSVARTADVDGDGKADLVWRSAHSQAASVWLMDGATRRTSARWTLDAGWTLVAAADFDGDGRSDLVWRSADGASVLWLMDGIAVRANSVIGASGESIAAIGDYNADGRADVVWQSLSGGGTELRLMNGAASLARALLFSSLEWSVQP